MAMWTGKMRKTQGFNKYLRSAHCKSGIVLDIVDTAENKTENIFALVEVILYC